MTSRTTTAAPHTSQGLRHESAPVRLQDPQERGAHRLGELALGRDVIGHLPRRFQLPY